MFSYKDRIQTFSDWPIEYKELTKRLAILGQFSTNERQKATECIYCKYKHVKWNIKDVPLLEHLKDDSSCPIYRLAYKTGRLNLSTLIKGISNRAKFTAYHNGKSTDKTSIDFRKTAIEDLLEFAISKKFIQINLDNMNLFFCMHCGSNDLSHSCAAKIQKITEFTDFNTSQFYIKYFNGNYIPMVEKYLQMKVETIENAKNLPVQSTLLYLANNNPTFNVFCSLEEFLKNCTEMIYDELTKKLKKIEKETIDEMYNESIIL